MVLSDTGVQSTFVMLAAKIIRLCFSNGEHGVAAVTDPDTLRSLRLMKDGVQWMTSPALKEWAEKARTAPPGTVPSNGELIGDLAVVVKPMIQAEYPPDVLTDALDWKLGNVIERDPGAGVNGYAGTVHRDLDDTAVGNLRSVDRARYFFNIWAPLTKVHCNPLAVLLPDSVDFSRDPAGFRGLEYDRTGLNHQPGHKWLGFPDMCPGDVLVWRSDVVYHAAYSGKASGGEDVDEEVVAVCDCPPSRRSVDVRFVVTDGATRGETEGETGSTK